MVEEIRVERFAGVAVVDDVRTGEKDVTVLALDTPDGREIAIVIPREQGFDAMVALMSGLAAAAAGSTSYRHVIGTSAWQIEPAEAGGAVLHAYLERSNGARLSFDLRPEHARQFAELLLRHADRMDEHVKEPAPPTSTARN